MESNHMSSKTDTFAESNPAVARCCNAYREAYRAALENRENRGYGMTEEEHYEPDAEGEQAYADALPPLLGVRSIRNFIACVAHGSAKGMLGGSDASRLLYAAQIAFFTRRLRPFRQENARSSQKPCEKPPLSAIFAPVSANQEPFQGR